MAYWRLLLAILVLLWGAPALAQDGDAGDGSSPPAESAAGDDAAEGDPAGDDAAEDAAGDDAGEDAADDAADEGAGDDAAAGDEGGDDEEDGDETVADAEPVEPNWVFSSFDADADGVLQPGEFGTGLFELVVGDGEGLDPDQYESVARSFGLDPLNPDFDTADVDQDGIVTDDQEFIPAVANRVFELWDADADNALSADEYRANMFAVFDADSNGLVSADEFEPFADWFDPEFEEVAGGGGGGFTEDFFMGEETAPGAAGEPAAPEAPADDAGETEETAPDTEDGGAGDGAGAENDADGDAGDADEEEEDGAQ
jgi:hypothetical protein